MGAGEFPHTKKRTEVENMQACACSLSGYRNLQSGAGGDKDLLRATNRKTEQGSELGRERQREQQQKIGIQVIRKVNLTAIREVKKI